MRRYYKERFRTRHTEKGRPTHQRAICHGNITQFQLHSVDAVEVGWKCGGSEDQVDEKWYDDDEGCLLVRPSFT